MKTENNLNENEIPEIADASLPEKKAVPRGTLQHRLLTLISRHPKGMSEAPLVTAAINMGSTEMSAKTCLYRLVKSGRLERTHRGWRIPPKSEETLPIPTLEEAAPKVHSGPKPGEVANPSSDRDLELAVALLEIKSLPKDRQDRIHYLASLLVSKKIRVF